MILMTKVNSFQAISKVIGISLIYIFSCQNPDRVHPSANLENNVDLKGISNSKYKLWYYGNFLGKFNEDALISSGLRLSLCQSFGEPSYMFSFIEQSEDDFSITAVSFYDDDCNLIYIKRGFEKHVWDSIVVVLSENDFLNLPEEDSFSGYDDSGGWIIEANVNGSANVVTRSFRDKNIYKSLLRPVKKKLDIDISTYEENMID